jgi:hypothetical protein
MAFHGDFSSFPLPELLQWLDSSRKSGMLHLSWGAGERKLFLERGHITATSAQGLWERIARLLALSHLAQGEAVMDAFAEMAASNDIVRPFDRRGLDPRMPSQLAREELFGAVADLTIAEAAQFHWTEGSDKEEEEWVFVEMGLSELMFESLRWLDEQPEVNRSLPQETLTVRAVSAPSPDLPLLHRVILTLCREAISLGRLTLAMGISRSTATRRVYDLLRAKRVVVDGAPAPTPDPIFEMLEKGSILVQEEQFEAAGLIFSSLLASDPSDRRIREFMRMVEREHVAALYRDLPPLFVPAVVNDPDRFSTLPREERQVASLINGTWDVSTIVLASPTRELETLKALSKLTRMGLLVPSTLPTQRGAVRRPPDE